MPFLLDMTIGNVFMRNSRRHSFYHLICWQSILGHDFSEEKMNTFLRERHNENFLADHEKSWTPLDAQSAFAQTIDLWVFSTREYMNEVLEKLVNVTEYALAKGAEIAASIAKSGMSGATDEFDKNEQLLLQELYQCINSDYKNSTAKDASFKSFDEFKQWTHRFRKENLVWEHDDPEKFDKQLTQQVFGFSLETCTDSICGVLLRQGRGFVNAAYRLGDVRVPIAKRIGEICTKRGTDKFGWPAIFETLRNWDQHLVGQSDRMTHFHPGDFTAGSDFLIKVVKMQDSSLHTVNFEGFCVGLWMSGYDPKAIENTLQVMGQTLKEKGACENFAYYMRLNRPDFVHEGKEKTAVITGFSKSDTGLIPRDNWDEIVRFTTESMRGGRRRGEAPEEPERDDVEQSQVVSDKHPQPEGIVPDETQQEVEKKENGGDSSMMPVAAFAAVIVGVLIFAR